DSTDGRSPDSQATSAPHHYPTGPLHRCVTPDEPGARPSPHGARGGRPGQGPPDGPGGLLGARGLPPPPEDEHGHPDPHGEGRRGRSPGGRGPPSGLAPVAISS